MRRFATLTVLCLALACAGCISDDGGQAATGGPTSIAGAPGLNPAWTTPPPAGYPVATSTPATAPTMPPSMAAPTLPSQPPPPPMDEGYAPAAPEWSAPVMPGPVTPPEPVQPPAGGGGCGAGGKACG